MSDTPAGLRRGPPAIGGRPGPSTSPLCASQSGSVDRRPCLPSPLFRGSKPANLAEPSAAIRKGRRRVDVRSVGDDGHGGSSRG